MADLWGGWLDFSGQDFLGPTKGLNLKLCMRIVCGMRTMPIYFSFETIVVKSHKNKNAINIII